MSGNLLLNKFLNDLLKSDLRHVFCIRYFCASASSLYPKFQQASTGSPKMEMLSNRMLFHTISSSSKEIYNYISHVMWNNMRENDHRLLNGVTHSRYPYDGTFLCVVPATQKYLCLAVRNLLSRFQDNRSSGARGNSPCARHSHTEY